MNEYIPYSGKFLEINIFGNYNENRISEISCLCVPGFRVIITGKLLLCQFFGNKISESEQGSGNFQKYLSSKIFHYTVQVIQHL